MLVPHFVQNDVEKEMAWSDLFSMAISSCYTLQMESPIKATFKTASPYQKDAMNLPVENVAAAIPFYENMMGFQVVSQHDSPVPSVILGRDVIQIGLAENGGDPSQEGCFFEVDNAETAFAELKANGLERDDPGFRIDQYGDVKYKVFFVIAPDCLCYCLGERVG